MDVRLPHWTGEESPSEDCPGIAGGASCGGCADNPLAALVAGDLFGVDS
jgi:hypothetical protein